MVRVTVVKFVVGVVVKTSVVVRFRFGFEFMVKIIVKIVWGVVVGFGVKVRPGVDIRDAVTDIHLWLWF